MLNHHPKRIVSLASSCTEILFALGAADRLVGVTRYCDFPPEAQKIEQVGGFIDINFRKVAELKPDLVLISSFLQRQAAEKLVNMDLNVLALNPICLNDIYKKIHYLGILTNKEKEAEKLVQQMMEKINSIEELARKMNHHPTVYLEEWGINGPIVTAGVWVAELTEKAGGRNIFPELLPIRHSSESHIRLEEVLKRNPEVIVSFTWTSSKFNVTRDEICNRPGWKNIKAVENNRIYFIDDRLIVRPGPRIVKGMELLFSFFYPDVPIPK